ncbi:GHKL domain-containing protein [Selenomonas sp.]|uniref:GHKL domain-containing protein n=1 Tax=Selenomonas sp. TaxID=2053611 RepID=UPI0025FF20A2|nr:GHKL domain-containing protein [Selenomonas sp.]
MVLFCLAVVLVQLAGAYLRFLSFRDQLQPLEVRALWRKFFLWSIFCWVLYGGIFTQTGLTAAAYKAVLFCGWLPYFLIFVRALPGRWLAHIFVFGMCFLWSFTLHNFSNIALAVFMRFASEAVIIGIHPWLYLVWFLFTLPLAKTYFIRLLPEPELFARRPLGIYIAVLPWLMLSGHVWLIADGALWHTWGERISRLCLVMGFLLAYRYILVAARQFYQRELAANNEEIMGQEITYLEDYQRLMAERKERAEVMQANLLASYDKLHDLLLAGKLAEARHYIGEQEQLLGAVAIWAYSSFPLVNAAISLYLRRAENQGIEVSPKVNLPQKMATDENDLAVLLSNLLENAIQACEGMSEPQLSLVLQHDGRQIVLEIVNPSARTVKIGADGLPVSDKSRPGHGIGTLSLKSFLAKYDGYVDFSQEAGLVRLFIYWEDGKSC